MRLRHRYIGIKRTLKSKGFFMPDNDLWIAATAIQYDITLAARDTHFDWIDELYGNCVGCCRKTDSSHEFTSQGIPAINTN
jgi:predicted nucleic acid-binding protein